MTPAPDSTLEFIGQSICTLNQLRHLGFTAPDECRTGWPPTTRRPIRRPFAPSERPSLSISLVIPYRRVDGTPRHRLPEPCTHWLCRAGSTERLLAIELVDELDRLSTQRKALRKRINLAVPASGTTLVDIFGIGDVIAAVIVGQLGDVARFRTADRFAAYNGTAPIEWSSGNPKHPVHRLSRRGNRTLNHAIHIAAVTQLRHLYSPGRGYHDRKPSQGQTGREALRSLKRRLSDVVYRHLVADAARRS